jgi:two-component system sensor histidine kinase ChvG
LIKNSTTSKRSTESGTATKNNRWFRLGARAPQLPEFEELLNIYWGGPERRITSLTLRIIAINAAPLIMLMLGILYLSQYQNTLIEAKLKTFNREVVLISSALTENDNGNEAKRLIWRLSKTMSQRIYLFDEKGTMTADSNYVQDFGPLPYIEQEQTKPALYTIEILKDMARFILKLFPERKALPVYKNVDSKNAEDYPDAATAMKGTVSMSAWRTDDDKILLFAAAPLVRDNKITGTVMLMQEHGRDIAQEIGYVWTNIVVVFIATLVTTIVLSIYLAGAIANPLRKLAQAAESMRSGRSNSEIPDLSARKDEIGELSIVLREMTQALWERMDSIERFAADVAHELKNPLTSLRSAVETLGVVKKDKDREKLLEIIQHDVERMDRLISDISNASRLDAELSRETLEPVDLKAELESLVESYQNPLVNAKTNARIITRYQGDKFQTWGLKGRIIQVLDNLISNALSFSPENGWITITLTKERKNVILTVEDQGPGIPENRLETIFDRFYTERPEHESYGRHSGLGLSICRQIVTALGGQIFAENTPDSGARFTIILNAA